MLPRRDVTAWRPAIEGVREVFHTRLVGHAYPMHAHSAWTLLIVDDGVIRYDLGRDEHTALRESVTVLPPHVPHSGTAVTPGGSRKRVVYLDTVLLGEDLVGTAVERPALLDRGLRQWVDQLHAHLTEPGAELAAETVLAMICDRLRQRLTGVSETGCCDRASLPGRLRDLLDARIREGVSLKEAAALLHAHPSHLARAFSKEFGMGPHQYLTGQRVDLARQMLLEGMAPQAAAMAAGFYDESHLARNFKRIVGMNPGHYARNRPDPCPGAGRPADFPGRWTPLNRNGLSWQ